METIHIIQIINGVECHLGDFYINDDISNEEREKYLQNFQDGLRNKDILHFQFADTNGIYKSYVQTRLSFGPLICKFE